MKEACGSENAAFLDGNMLRVDFRGEEVELVAEGDLLIKGEHNVSNALAAAAAALACGVDAAQVREGSCPLSRSSIAWSRAAKSVA